MSGLYFNHSKLSYHFIFVNCSRVAAAAQKKALWVRQTQKDAGPKGLQLILLAFRVKEDLDGVKQRDKDRQRDIDRQR